MKFANLVYFEDEALTRKIDMDEGIDLGSGAKLDEVRKKTFWMFNLGDAKLLKLRIVPTDSRLKVVEAPSKLAPQRKAPVTVEFRVSEPKDLKCKLDITGVYEE